MPKYQEREQKKRQIEREREREIFIDIRKNNWG